MISYTTDVTEHKRIEDELRKLASVVEHTSEFISLASLDEKIIFVNEAGAEMLGISAEKIGKIPILDAITEKFKEKVKNEVFPTLKKKGRWEGELQYRNLKTGKLTDVYATTFTINDPVTQKPLYLANTSIDITERKRVEMQVEQSRKTFTELVERAPFGIYIVDSQFRISLMNVGSQNGAFRNVRPVIGRPFNEAMHILWPDTIAEEIIAHFRHTLDTGEPYYSPQFINPRHDEKIVESYEWELHRITLPDGQYGVICYYFDSTKLRQAEEKLKRLTEELQRSNKELEEYANILSHDLREPIRAIGGFTQLLHDRYSDRFDGKAGEYIHFAIDGAKRMNELVTGLLECARVQTRGERPMLIPAHAALRAAIENLQNKIDEAKAVVTSDDLPQINADGRQLTQLFQYLLDNAIKFRNGQPQIHVGCEKKDDCWQFFVRDNGIGIEKQFHERIFKIFQRLHTLSQYPGIGVGLPICQKIVERHGGKIWVESEEGNGSTFYFTIQDKKEA